ncbi:hypothetical protein RA2_03695 [Roseovarius sp. A-2]|nr:hypothetical protein RA2_03695 [Roseovarius sp. A-2]
MMTNRHNRHSPSQCVTCAGQNDRHKRHTTLGSVTGVTLAKMAAGMVPMPLFLSGQETGGMTFLSTHTGGLADG